MMIPHTRRDIDVFSRLYDTYAPALYGVILKLTPDVQLASSILEKSFLRIWVELNDHDVSKERLFTLMLRITLQECKHQVVFSKDSLPQLFTKEERSTPSSLNME
ncbi:MAG TPA: hypothetical protein VEZ55_15170 [Chitinophagaceae bacterium]|jgi:DNA-directed RNA polymerase specialized sigma24 family protein|nr:hypothetical protein [Chitinophagaceae bacterium]